MEAAWYSELRTKWKPARVRLLLIAESAPDDGGDTAQRRFFYSDRLAADNLFRGVVEAMYNVRADSLRRTGKAPWLERLRADGVYLIDLVPYPINRLPHREKRSIQRDSVTNCVERAAQLNPEGIIVIKKDVFDLLAQPLRDAGLPLLHAQGMSFPLGNVRADFVSAFRDALTRLEEHRTDA